MPDFPILIALDLFCGLGGWSDGLAETGFNVIGIEIETKIAAKYNHDCIIADCRNAPLRRIAWDLIVGSPPCREFTALLPLSYKWKVKPNLEAGLELVNAFRNIVKETKPRYWLMENVPGLKKHIDLKPRIESRLGRGMRRCFWGKFPSFFIHRDYSKGINQKDFKGKFRKWERAKIPLPISKALGEAVRNSFGVV